jgi:hypothetical protein
VACGFRRITSNAWEVHGLWSTTAIMSQQQSKGRLASCLPPGARYSSVRHDLRTSGRRASLLVRLSYLSTSQMRSELHQMAAGRRVGKCTVHAGLSHRSQAYLQPIETTSCVSEADRVVRASNRMRRSRSALDRRARSEGTQVSGLRSPDPFEADGVTLSVVLKGSKGSVGRGAHSPNLRADSSLVASTVRQLV